MPPTLNGFFLRSFQVGDMISVIDMPPADESVWWRGKRGFDVGFFPMECVEVISSANGNANGGANANNGGNNSNGDSSIESQADHHNKEDQLDGSTSASSEATSSSASSSASSAASSASGSEPSKPVLRKHGKLISFFRSFILSRPSRGKLKKSGILRERVFGCDLAEHLLNTGQGRRRGRGERTRVRESHPFVGYSL